MGGFSHFSLLPDFVKQRNAKSGIRIILLLVVPASPTRRLSPDDRGPDLKQAGCVSAGGGQPVTLLHRSSSSPVDYRAGLSASLRGTRIQDLTALWV